MTAEPAQIRAHIDALLAEVPATADGFAAADIEMVAARLDEAHDVLVQALESVEKG